MEDQLQETFSFLAEFVDEGSLTNGVDESTIESFERQFGLVLPETYRQFLKQFGVIDFGGLRIYGLGVPHHLLPSIECAINVTRARWPEVPLTWVPFFKLSRGVFACMDCAHPAKDSPIYLLDLSNYDPNESPIILAESFTDFLALQTLDYYHFLKGVACLEQHFIHPEFVWDNHHGGKLPRKEQWRPYRVCVQDVLLGITVLRHNRQKNILEVDVFLTASIPEYEADSGVRALTLILLSEAYQAGGTMEIHFTDRVEERNVPGEIVLLARQLGVELCRAAEGIVSVREAIDLYIALTKFSPKILRHLKELEHFGRLSLTQVCYSIHHNIWERSEIEAIILTCPRPESLLRGRSLPEIRHLFLEDLHYGRAAVMFGNLERRLRARSHRRDKDLILLEDDECQLQMELDGETYTVNFFTDNETLSIPWVYVHQEEPGKYEEISLPAASAFSVMVRARDQGDLEHNLMADISLAGRLHQPGSGCPFFIFVPRDFEKLSMDFRSRVVSNFPPGVRLMVYREFASSIDDDVSQRLVRSGGLRA